MKKTSHYFLLLLAGLCACNSNKEENCVFIPDTKSSSIDLTIEALEDSIPSFTTKDQLISFLTKHPVLRDMYFNRKNYPNDDVFVNTLFNRLSHPAIDTLVMETHRIFGDGAALKEEFRNAFANIRYYYPDFPLPKIITMISGFQPGTDLLVSDTLIIVGLDYYLGKGARFRPNDMYEYMLRRYQPDFVVPSVLLLYGIDPAINKTQLSDKTVLADMISFGKAYYFAKHMLPCVADSIFIGYTKKEIEGSKENEGAVYARLLENEVLYSTSHQIKQRYLEERPKTLEVGADCPGRIAQWVGWQMVKTYASRYPEKSLPDIMNIPGAEKIFKDSKYKPDLK